MIEELMAAWEAGTLTEEQRARLNALAREDPGPIAEQLRVEAMLRWHHGLNAAPSHRIVRWMSVAAAAALLVGAFFLFRTPDLSPDWRVTGAAEWRVLDSNRIRLARGELHVAGNGNLVIETPHGEATASGTEFLIAVHHGGDAMFTRVFVLAGIVTLTNAMGSAAGGPSELLLARQDEAPAKEVVRSNSQFGIDLYRHLAAEKPDENLFISPYSIASVLAMASEGARRETARQMGEMLHYPQAARREGDDAQRIPWETARIHTGMAELNRLFNRQETAEEKEMKREIEALREKLNAVNEAIRKAMNDGDWRGAGDLEDEGRAQADRINELQRKIAAYELSAANALWGERTCPFDPAFVKTLADSYDTGAVREADFKGDPNGERLKINAWAAERTHDRIKEILADGMVTSDVRLILVNALYFKGEWVSPFDPAKTKRGPFTLADGTAVDTDLMNAGHLETARYAAFNDDGSAFETPKRIQVGQKEGLYPGDDGFAMVELAYRGDDVAMVVIVPNRADGLAALEKRLSAESLEEWIGTLETRATTVALPKFRSESSLTLNETLKALGMTDAFDPKRADFSGMTTAELLYVGFVVHKTFLDVNEKGSEAAAVTAMGMRAGGVPQTVPFIPVIRADRPFVYLIRDVRSGTVLFVGRMVTP
ncbi:MAG: hypothetical protein A3F84_07600 [Candidatus Handelsmanbacteria bacterium RIFCSPLOWO2_12_FULL_64_10]|uniref:Serpin domain-containing protein n=1 Tax=Handelsmanbacteria sp. (strain RIFCSPLOWO2_12_FULL_64_10) TaxID=1817868 RepID=A0A1F6CRM8_HANXR|nr:MAG: hypothetical protein A3F84_07600 [Candidatus Handelsmanbacteria bacterium RIFCSPLOWO2_12_FULL_64_10]